MEREYKRCPRCGNDDINGTERSVWRCENGHRFCWKCVEDQTSFLGSVFGSGPNYACPRCHTTDYEDDGIIIPPWEREDEDEVEDDEETDDEQSDDDD